MPIILENYSVRHSVFVDTKYIFFVGLIVFSIYLKLICCFFSLSLSCDIAVNIRGATNVHFPFILLINAWNVRIQYVNLLNYCVKKRKFNENMQVIYDGTLRGHRHTVHSAVRLPIVILLSLVHWKRLHFHTDVTYGALLSVLLCVP
jgi:hypothetical protein